MHSDEYSVYESVVECGRHDVTDEKRTGREGAPDYPPDRQPPHPGQECRPLDPSAFSVDLWWADWRNIWNK